MISVVIPTYKPSLYFKETLKSLALQTLQDFELIIVLNGCDEPYVSTINKWLKEFGINGIIIHTNISGVSNARNIGIEYSKSEYICFIDDDDKVSERYFEELWNARLPNGIVFSNIVTFDEESEQIENPYSKTYYSLSNSLKSSLVSCRHLLNGPWGKLYPKELIGEFRFNTKLSRGEDALFNFSISSQIFILKAAKKDAIYYYRLNLNGATCNKLPLNKYLPIHLEQMKSLFKTYMKAPLKYNFPFFVTRVFASYKYFIQTYLFSGQQRKA